MQQLDSSCFTMSCSPFINRLRLHLLQPKPHVYQSPLTCGLGSYSCHDLQEVHWSTTLGCLEHRSALAQGRTAHCGSSLSLGC